MQTRDIIEILGVFMGGVAAIGYAFGQFRHGQSDRRKDDVGEKKDAFGLLQEQVDSLAALCDKQKTQITILQTQAEEREKKAKEYIEIFQNRNPEMVAFMTYMTSTAKTSESYMKDTGLLFTTLKSIMEKTSEALIQIEKHLNKEEKK